MKIENVKLGFFCYLWKIKVNGYKHHNYLKFKGESDW